VLYFLVFLLFPNLAKAAWISLVIYTNLVIVLQFIWQFSFAANSNVIYRRLWGLETHTNLWYQLRFHLVILIFAAIQLHAFDLLRQKTRELETSDIHPSGLSLLLIHHLML
jgi:hypothetical protein